MCENLYKAVTEKTLPKADRFLFRAYEIALFSEKYFNEIKWDEIEQDIKKQKMNVVFKNMITDILEIFPKAFPNQFIETVYHLDYIEFEHNSLYNAMRKAEGNNAGALLCAYIDDKWAMRQKNNIHIKIGDSFILTKNCKAKQKEKSLFCHISTKKTLSGMELEFAVLDDDLYFSSADNFDTKANDGVHLLLCGTEENSYNSIFFFSKAAERKMRVLACNMLSSPPEILPEDWMKAHFAKTKDGYILSVMISNSFILKNHMENYFYMGLVISDCDSKEKRRKNEMILSQVSAEWYNPIYFAKIEMNE